MMNMHTCEYVCMLNSLKPGDPLIKMHFQNSLKLLNYFNIISFLKMTGFFFFLMDDRGNTSVMVQNKSNLILPTLKAAYRSHTIEKVSKTPSFIKRESVYKPWFQTTEKDSIFNKR